MKNRTTNVELLQNAMNYLPLYDLSLEKLSEDYLSCNFGDFTTRFLFRMAYEGGKRTGMPLDKMIDELQSVMSGVANDVHKVIDAKDKDTLGVLSPSCAFLHEMSEMNLVELHFEVLYPFLAHTRRNDPVSFDECEHLGFLPCYANATQDDLFRMAKIRMHSQCANELRDAYVGMLGDFVYLYKALDFQTSREYADFAEFMGNLREESDKDLYDTSQDLWQYKVRHAIGFEASESEFKSNIERIRGVFGSHNEGHIMYVTDLFLHSNIGMIDSKFGVKTVQCLDYYLSLRVPLDEMKEAKRHV